MNCQNIGFDSDDCVKIFDFGLARRMGNNNNKKSAIGGESEAEADQHSSREDWWNKNNNNERNGDSTYDMSGQTGTLRYMAPEVYTEAPYSAKADVYSLAVVTYQVLSLLQPFANVPPSKFESTVIKGGMRPTVDLNWPSAVRDLLARMWSPESKQRPSSEEVHAILESILRGSDDSLYPTSAFQRIFSGEGCLKSPPNLCPA